MQTSSKTQYSIPCIYPPAYEAFTTTVYTKRSLETDCVNVNLVFDILEVVSVSIIKLPNGYTVDMQ
jgi:hypothetical protein